ncbi:MAG: PspC domain-containing protein [Actinomycetota bacterium]|nr:PspC domain-containing protein [Actinomycetota bacterium]
MSTTAPVRPPLVRAHDDRLVSGVCAAVARHLGMDPLIVRGVFVALALGGIGVLIYALLWVFLPQADTAGVQPDLAKQNAAEYAGTSGLRLAALRDKPSLAILLIGVGGALLLTQIGPFGEVRVLWPLVIVGIGLALIWRQVDDRDLLSRRSLRWRLAAGALVTVVGLVTVLTTLNLLEVTWQSFVSTLLILGGVGLATAPWWRRLVAERSSERRARIRVEERAEVAAHLHDSVLQTLALIQRHAESPREVNRLARGQERELRSWLYGHAGEDSATFGGALERAVADIEASYDVRVQSVVVGDEPVDEGLAAVVQASHEAMRNAARHAGVQDVSLYAEVENDAVTVYVRDRGVGFDPDSIAEDRRGVRHSIVERMVRHGGHARITSTPGTGTEVELRMSRVAS